MDATRADSTQSAPRNEAAEFLAADGGFFRNENPAPMPDANVQDPITPTQQTAADPIIPGSDGEPSHAPDLEPTQAPSGEASGAPMLSAEEIEQLRQAAQAAEFATRRAQQIEEQNRQMRAEQERQRLQEQQRIAQQTRQQNIDRAYEIHDQLVSSGQPERASAYIRQFHQDMQAADAIAWQAQIANTQRQADAAQHAAVQPLYAAHTVATHQLPQEFVPLLAQFDGYTQDRLVPIIKTINQSASQRESEKFTKLDQQVRELQAAQRSNSGAFNPAGNSGGAAPVAPSERPTDRRAAEVWDYLHAGE